MTEALDTIAAAVAALARGGMVLVVDDENRENEGDLILAAEHATAANIAFLVRHTSGVLCVPMTGEDCDRLQLPPMTAVNQDPKGTAYTVSVDAISGVSTGISAADRAQTMRLLADPRTTPGELSRPGHVFPLRANAR
ncbi:3,4-dihydroxy-2-butanone-4-phosphate synthase, partial [Nocardia sp. NPDC004722]